ncbi:MAG: sigma-70 family RNA polymerase sigma factor [Pseudomonadota bacterium]|nr:sigma-70 family RNA polymerase sigma factor [Pseudomonadota bacterium]
MGPPAQDQFRKVVLPHLEALFRVAYRLLRNTPDAQDLVQDTCATACGRIQELAKADSPQRWLLTVLHNRFIDGQRRHRRSPIVAVAEAEDFDQRPSQDFDPADLAQQFQDENTLEQAFLKLTDTQRTLLSLRAEGYELPEIEAITGIDRKVLSARLNRARVTLAQRLTELKREVVGIRRIGSRS